MKNHLKFTIIDGAVFMNNPAIEGLNEARYLFPGRKYMIVSLGTGSLKIKIAEHTYYNIPFLHNDKRRPYDVFGAYVNTVTTNEKYPDRPYFTPREILERQDLWTHKKGLMLYPKEDKVRQVSEMLADITYVEPGIPVR